MVLLTYLDDEVLQRLLVLGRVLVKLRLQFVDRKRTEIIQALVPLLHLLKARLVVAFGDHLFVLDVLVGTHLLEALLQFDQLFLVDALALSFTVALSEHLNLERLFVGVLAHHALQLESISVELHLLFNWVLINNSLFLSSIIGADSL